MNARNTSRKMHLAAILFSAAAFGASSPALALSPENSAMTPQTLTQEEIRFLMGNRAPQNRPASLAYLSQQEMADTEGKAGPIGAGVGGVLGFFEYMGEVAASGKEPNTIDAVKAIAGGAILGFFGGEAIGLAEGIASKYMLSFSAGVAKSTIERIWNEWEGHVQSRCITMQSIDKDEEYICDGY